MELREEEEGYRLLDVASHLSYMYAKDKSTRMGTYDAELNKIGD